MDDIGTEQIEGSQVDGTESQRVEEERLPGTSLPYETIMNEVEMEFLQKFMPKGYSLSNSFRSTRPRVSKYVALSSNR